SAPGDVIYIKHNGRLEIEPTVLAAGRKVTLCPYENAHPILVLGKTGEKDKEVALFQLLHSQIDFRDLEFQLHPESDYRSLAVVSLGGNSRCQFKNCAVTLDNSDRPAVNLYLAALLDPDKGPKGPPPPDA